MHRFLKIIITDKCKICASVGNIPLNLKDIGCADDELAKFSEPLNLMVSGSLATSERTKSAHLRPKLKGIASGLEFSCYLRKLLGRLG